MTEISPYRLIREAFTLNITANTVIDISDVEKDILQIEVYLLPFKLMANIHCS